MRATGYADLGAYLSQGDIEEDTGTLDRDPDPRVRILVEILETRRGPRQLLQGFRAFARQAELNAQGVGGDLFGHAPGALQTLAQAFGLDVPNPSPRRGELRDGLQWEELIEMAQEVAL